MPGRKSCPLSLPMNPTIVKAEGVRQAFERREEATAAEREFRVKHKLDAVPRQIAVDGGAGEIGTQRVRRRDAIASRQR
jgi:predicted metalloprotease